MDSEAAAQPTSLGARLRVHLGRKIAVWLGLAAGICIPYFSLQHVDWMPVRTLPVTFIDRAVGFSPGWIWAYVSLALLVPLAPLVATRRDELRRYAIGLTLLCAPCFVIFLLLPVAGPRPGPEAQVTGLYAAIVSIDRPSNSLPSLHAGLTVYSLLFAHRVFGRGLRGAGHGAFVTGAIVWGALILYSTLATKQHWVLDLPPAIVIAWLADRVAWRGTG